VEANEELEWSVAIDSISKAEPPPKTLENINAYGLEHLDFLHLRHRLASALRAQPNDGGVHRKHFDALHIDGTSCTRALGLEWGRYRADLKKLGQQPGMSDFQLAQLAARTELIDQIQHSRRVIRIWEALQELINRADIEVSGRLTLTQDNGQRTVKWRGISPISAQFTVPTLLLDATLPPLPMLQVYHPRAQIVADIKVALPNSVYIRQLIGAPTSARKLDNGHHKAAIRRYILARYLALNRPPTLVICQQKADAWLMASGLPDNISVEHFNNVTQAMEALTAALTGKPPVPATTGSNGFHWYETVQRGIRLRDGSGVATKGDQHPDPEVEAVRWQIHEGELVQALGRGRGVNRTADTPLDADLLFDTCLPITVDKVERWQAPSLLIETAIKGVMLTARVDLVKLWPALWPNDTAARRTLEQGIPQLPGFERVEYQLAGPKMKKRIGYFDPRLIPDPHAWLTQRLGRLI
jgi:hypothetical protein